MATNPKTPRDNRVERRNEIREQEEAPRTNKKKKASATTRGKTPARQPAPARTPAPATEPTIQEEPTVAEHATPERGPMRTPRPQVYTSADRESSPHEEEISPATRISPTTLTPPTTHMSLRDTAPYDAENEDDVSDASIEEPRQEHAIRFRSPPLADAIRSSSQPPEAPHSPNFGVTEVPPPAPSGLGISFEDKSFRRVTLASASFNVPWPFHKVFALQALLVEYKRLTPFPRTPTIPFDVYTLQLCGINDINVSDEVRHFVTPNSALHRSTQVDNGYRRRVLESYHPVVGHSYQSRNIPEAHRGIVDAKSSGNLAIYNISEFNFHLDNEKRAWMDTLFPIMCLLYHVLLTYIRYLAVTSDFLPILGNCSFTTRIMVRVGFGLFSTYIYSNPAIFVQTIFGMLVQWLFYHPYSITPEIRDSLKTAPLYGWLLLHGFFYLFALVVDKVLAENDFENIPWLPVISSHAIWDVIGMSLDPMPITIKLGCGYLTYQCVTKHVHAINHLYKGLLQTAKHAEDEVRAANAIWEKINNATAIVMETSSNM